MHELPNGSFEKQWILKMSLLEDPKLKNQGKKPTNNSKIDKYAPIAHMLGSQKHRGVNFTGFHIITALNKIIFTKNKLERKGQFYG